MFLTSQSLFHLINKIILIINGFEINLVLFARQKHFFLQKRLKSFCINVGWDTWNFINLTQRFCNLVENSFYFFTCVILLEVVDNPKVIVLLRFLHFFDETLYIFIWFLGWFLINRSLLFKISQNWLNCNSWNISFFWIFDN